jgi:hypothetical protein
MSVQPLFPDLVSASDEPSTADEIARQLQEVVDEIRDGRRNVKFVNVVTMRHDTKVSVITIGAQSKYDQILSLDLAHHLALSTILDEG